MSEPQSPSASEQDYIPGTTVIKNLVDRDAAHPYGTSDPQHLELAETFRASRRMDELRAAPVSDAFTFAHMRQIHQHIFQDVYAWAGEPRRVPMQKHGTDYAGPAEMASLLRAQYSSVKEQDYLRGISDHAEFTQKLATLWAEMNHAHAFREGNTRSQTVFFEQLAEHAGWKLDVARLAPQHPISIYKPFVDARFEHQRLRAADPSLSASETAQGLAKVLGGIIAPDRSPEGALRRGVAPANPAPAPERDKAGLHVRYPELRGLKLDPYGLDANDATLSLPVDPDYHP